jgi:hypothetical protein
MDKEEKLIKQAQEEVDNKDENTTYMDGKPDNDPDTPKPVELEEGVTDNIAEQQEQEVEASKEAAVENAQEEDAQSGSGEFQAMRNAWKTRGH